MNGLLDRLFKLHIVRSAIKIALVVGTILNLINQGEVIVTDGIVSWPHFFLNYLVPYCVASYSAARNELSQAANKPAGRAAPLDPML